MNNLSFLAVVGQFQSKLFKNLLFLSHFISQLFQFLRKQFFLFLISFQVKIFQKVIHRYLYLWLRHRFSNFVESVPELLLTAILIREINHLVFYLPFSKHCIYSTNHLLRILWNIDVRNQKHHFFFITFNNIRLKEKLH